ncbi:hypothetical protein K492DRAFT_210896 [Lichtheimia hyalospora FSU 10163]|nr:hypothetical protein K492DRAFT_210896 [Lichtheimia hyalospora FSU 10163]
MTISLGTNVLDNLRMAASQGQHERVITDSKVICQQLAHLHLETLDIQARSYVARAQFTTALNIATSMQEMNPTSPLGYLCQGYIHMQQGRCLAAIRVYDKAMDHVPMTDTLYERVKEDRSLAMKQATKPMDLIAYFPNDINFRIFPLLFGQCWYEQYRQYLLVSSVWLACMLQWGQLGFTIVDNIPEEETNPVIIKSFHHVRSIQFIHCESPFYKLFKIPNTFHSLTSLNVNLSSLGYANQAISTIQSISDTLTTLTLRDYACLDLPLSLNDILSSCPKLVSFHCVTDIKLSSLEGTYPSLLYLTLHTITRPMDGDDLMNILPRLPCLKMLDLCNVPTSMPMQVINTSLHALQDLKFSDKTSLYLDVIAWIIQRSPYLHRIIMGIYAVNESIMNAMAQCVHLNTIFVDDLRYLSMVNRPDEYDTSFAQFIKKHVDHMATRGGSRLETLIMGMVSFDPTLVQSMGALTRLQELSIVSLQQMDTSFGHLFKALSQGCRELHTLSIRVGLRGDGKLSNDVLYHIHSFPNLRELSIMADLSESNLGALSIQKCSRLQSVSFLTSIPHEEILRALKDKIPVVHPW